MNKILVVLLSLTLALTASAQTESYNEDFQKEIWRVTQIIGSPELLDSLVSRIHSSSHLIKAFDQEIAMLNEGIIQKKRDWISSFRLGLNIFSADTYVGGNNESITNVGVLPHLGATISLDPERLINRKSFVRQATNQRQRVYHLQQDHKQRLKKEIIDRYYDYLMALESIVLNEQTLNTRKQHLSMMEVEFRGGNVTYDQLLLVQNQYNIWETEYMKSKISALKKRSEINIMLSLTDY
ncbi:MAG: outer membrane protein TolC [Cyclobacteriaceae bacterium]|jgi:outer membrane protein TolC